MVHSTLIDLGFHPKEAEIYLALLPLGYAHASTLARKTDISRTTIIYHCEQMLRKGVIKRQKKDQAYVYSPESPDRITYLFDQQMIEIQNKKDQLGRIIGDLKALINPATNLPRVHFYQGVNGVIQIYEDMLKTNQDIYTWTDISRIYDVIGDYMYTFIKKRVQRRITTHAIMPKTKMAIDHEKLNEKRKVKYVGTIPIEGEIRIYGSKIAIIYFNKEHPIGFTLDNELISNMFKVIFENEWKNEG